jgi:uncharacterized protein YbjT (DUF2867 family)
MILVVGATGTTGRAVVGELVERGASVRALTRSPEQAAALRAAGAEPVVGDLADPASLAPALDGVERLYIALPASEQLPELEANAYAAAEQAGVYHAVKLGVMGMTTGASMRLARTHAEAFEALQSSSLRWTLLQPSGFMQNYLRSPGAVVSARADAQVAHIDARDIAAVAARVLSEEGHEACTYALTGPEALSDAQIAELLGAEYRAVTDDEAAAAMRGRGMAEWYIGAMLDLNEHYRSGAASAVSPDVEALLGRPAGSFAALVADQRAGAAG